MKVLIALCLFAVVGFAYGHTQGYPRGCIYVNGRCYKGCEEGTHSYSVGCAPVTPEPTCDEPNPVQGQGAICDYSSCYCDPPTVRHTATRKCVLLEDCPKQETTKKDNGSE